MALFKRKSPDGKDGGENGKGDSGVFEPQPDKARKWFEFARTAATTSNHEYALNCYADGLKLDPGSIPAHEAMFESAVRYGQTDKAKPATSKELKKFDDGTPIGKFVAAEFAWMKNLQDPKAAIKCLEAAVKADQLEFGNLIARRVFLLLKKKKLNKAAWLTSMQLFRSVSAWEESMAAGEAARALDPADAELDAELKNLSAQRAMDQGGYDRAAGTEGGFRQFIRDADRQQELLEEESIAGGGSIEERNFARAKAEYERNPTVPDAINRYAQLLKKTGDQAKEAEALEVYEKGFRDTGEYRFRMLAGDIRIEWLDREVRELDEKLAANADPLLQQKRDDAWAKLVDLRSTEYQERVEKYPTDRNRKFALGRVLFDQGKYDKAMEQFQAAKDEPKLKVRATHMLGRSFMAESWLTEAISEYEEALQVIDATERDRELEIKYDLMLALLAAAREDDSIDFAKQAKTICSEIARRDITYKDIRERRREVDQIIRDLVPGG